MGQEQPLEVHEHVSDIVAGTQDGEGEGEAPKLKDGVTEGESVTTGHVTVTTI